MPSALLRHVRPRWLILATASLIFSQLIGLATPYLLKLAIDEGISRADSDLLWGLGIAGLILYSLGAIARFGGQWYATLAGEDIWESARDEVFQHVQQLSLATLATQRTGELVSRIYSDTFHIKQLATSVLPALTSLLVGVGGTAAILIWLDPRLALLAAIPLPVGWLLLHIFRRRVRPMSRARLETMAALHSSLHEGLAGIADIQALGAREIFARRVRDAGRSLKAAELALASHRARLGPAVDLALSLVLLATLVIGGQYVIEGSLSVGTLVVFYFYVGRCLGPLRGVPGILYGWHGARAAAERIDALLAVAPRPPAAPSELRPPPGPLRVRVESLSFAYPPSNTFTSATARGVIDGLTLELAPSEAVAILGPSGAGKSTTGRLLLNLFDPEEGRVILQGLDARDWPLSELRRRVGYVGQEIFLFDGSLRDNLFIAMSPEERQQAEPDLDAILKLAGLHDFVHDNPEGLDAPMGERGARLSGGQKKRVALARALLRNPDLVIIDQMATDLEESLNARIFSALRLRKLTLIYLGHRVPAGLDPEHVFWMEGGCLHPGPPDRHQP
ncbi:ABC transporter ATP-binding protein [Bradymonadaceae bacterium TMQ3]|nr:ABC transporter ATP-binding protein [Bradymonadaceae bacterium TMQ3]TXC75758.1 ABC transporter ATP-binding protein [Bradymonadales bacterium TMQ1]